MQFNVAGVTAVSRYRLCSTGKQPEEGVASAPPQCSSTRTPLGLITTSPVERGRSRKTTTRMDWWRFRPRLGSTDLKGYRNTHKVNTTRLGTESVQWPGGHIRCSIAKCTRLNGVYNTGGQMLEVAASNSQSDLVLTILANMCFSQILVALAVTEK